MTPQAETNTRSPPAWAWTWPLSAPARRRWIPLPPTRPLHALQAFPQLQAVAFTLRDAHSASRNRWGGVIRTRTGRYESSTRMDLDLLDRVGGGDAFVSGLIHGFLAGKGAQAAVDLGAAHGALAMTTPGDNAMASLAEVEAIVRGDAAAVRR